MTEKEHENRIVNLQKICFKYHRKSLEELSIRNISMLKVRYNLKKWFSKLELNELNELSERLNITIRNEEEKDFLIDILISMFEKIKREDFENISSFPTEIEIFNKEQEVLPKLNLQFLSFKDYLIRNYKLFKNSTHYNLKLKIEECLMKTKPKRNLITNQIDFQFYKYCLPLKEFRILEKINSLNYYEGMLQYNLKDSNRNEFEYLKQFDILILLNVLDEKNIKLIRGCEVIHQEDMDGTKYIEDNVQLFGSERRVKIKLDKIQYEKDNENGVEQKFNLILKINSKENNFISVLETLKELILNCKEDMLPDWFNDLFLGYGNPSDSSYKNISTSLTEINIYNTISNLKELYPSVKCETLSSPPSKVYLNEEREIERIKINNYNDGIKLTKNQFESILSGVNYGLTVINGPPASGKSMIAIEIILNLYKNNERNLIITHSNNGLNDLFKKILSKNEINESHLLRLGHGESELNLKDKDFTKYGRMNFILERRLKLLDIVSKLNSKYSSSCERSSYYFTAELLPSWLKYIQMVDLDYLKSNFPFYILLNENEKNYITEEKSLNKLKEFMLNYFKHNIESIFNELEEYKAFEIIRSNQEREKYILTKISKIILMTSTHSSLKRNYFLNNHFEFDNLIIEESSQLLEIESFIPMILQKKKLKRVIILGDNEQLNPIIKNEDLKKYNFNQTLFHRLIRLGVPFIQLNSQNRMRKELSSIWKINYKYNIEDIIDKEEENNIGFKYNYQFFNIENGEEIQSVPHYYQNLQEAECIVAIYMYMRLIGYDNNKITILTTYNGQKDLINDILKRRCDNIPFLKSCQVFTVDNYQGQQNDYILLSLVRTKSVGHLRNVKRLIVSLSRSRKGLYIVGKKKLFENCIELQSSLNELFKHPTDYLHLDEKKINNLKELGKLVYNLLENKLKNYNEVEYIEEEETTEKMQEEPPLEYLPTGMEEDE